MPATAADAPPLLASNDVARFYRDGFLAVQRFVTAEDLDEVRRLLDPLFDRFWELPRELAFDLGDVKNHRGEQRTPQINVAIRFEPKLRETRVFKAAHAIARQLLGDDVNYSYDHAIYKPARSNRDVPWHQDLAYGGRADAICCNANFWIPLQEATVANGCMWFIPHSHLGGLLPHRPVGGNPLVHTLECDVNASKAVACPLPPGGCTIQHGKTLHYTGPNSTDNPRRAWIINFGSHVENSWQV